MPVELPCKTTRCSHLKVDPHYGIRTTRRLSCLPDRLPWRIITTYQSAGPPQTSALIITQCEPEMVYIPLPSPSKPGEGYEEQSKDLPPN